MVLLWIGVALVLLRWLEVGPFAQLSWWWPVAALAGAALWFERLERFFGKDRRQMEMLEAERRRRERVAREFDVRRPRR
jgi:small Trp-rich protein